MKRRAWLLYRRHPRSLPVAGSALLLGLSALLVGSVSLGLARAKSAELKAEAERLQHVDQKEKMVDSIVTMVRDRRDVNSPSAAWLNAMTFLESVVGPTIVKPGQSLTDWSERTVVAEALVEKARAAGQQNDLEIMLLESCLCVWLIHADQAANASARLPDLRARWEQVVRPDDPWLVQLRSIEMCAKALDESGGKTLAERRQILKDGEDLSNTLRLRPVALQDLFFFAGERLSGIKRPT